MSRPGTSLGLSLGAALLLSASGAWVWAAGAASIKPAEGPVRAFGDRTATRAFQVEAQGPCVLEWRTRVMRGVIERGKIELNAPGRVETTVQLPAVRARVEFVQELQLKQAGRVLAETTPTLSLYPDSILREGVAAADGKRIGVIDPQGDFTRALEKAGAQFAPVQSNLDLLRATARVVVCAPNQRPTAAEPWSGLRSFVDEGGSVIFLEQQAPLSLPWLGAAGRCNLEPRAVTDAQPLVKRGHVVLRDTVPGEEINRAGQWGTTGPVLSWPEWPRCRALVVDGATPSRPILLEAWNGGGRTLLCQADVGRRLSDDPAAQLILRNVIDYCRTPPPQRARETLLAVMPEAVRRGRFDSVRLAPTPGDDAIKQALGLLVIVTPAGAPAPGPGCDLAALLADGGRIVVQSSFGPEMLGALNALAAEACSAGNSATRPPELVAASRSDARVECDYEQPPAWGIPADRVERALAGADDARAVGVAKPSPLFSEAVKPGVLTTLQCARGQIVLCALPADDPGNADRAWIVRQVVNNTGLYTGAGGGYPVQTVGR